MPQKIHTLTTVYPVVGHQFEVKDANSFRAAEGCLIVSSDTVSHILPLSNVIRATQVIVED